MPTASSTVLPGCQEHHPSIFMLFPTYQFLVFFIIIFSLGTSLKNKIGFYKLFLLLSSLVFYYFWSWYFLGLLITSTAINYWILLTLSKSKSNQKILLILGIICNCLYLGFFKYYNFFTSSLFDFLNSLNLQWSFPVLQILAPIGISFYTFRIISHLVDCYTERVNCPQFLDYAVYVTYFPQIASGPIARAKEFYEQLNSPHKYDYKIESVIVLILSGLFKKYTLSSFFFNFTQLPFTSPQQYSSLDLLLAAVSYSCLIYVDFSGYSDLSNAISSLLGFKPIPNFNMPYQALSLQDFWKRWHISLSEWLRDYLYIPLGGNKFGKVRKYLNLLLTFLIGGFWHGAGFNFIIWGILQGCGLIISHAVKDYSLKIANLRAGTATYQAMRCLNWLLTFGFVTFSWIFFNSSSWETAIAFLQGIFQSPIKTIQFNFWQLYSAIVIVFIINFYGVQLTKAATTLFSLKNLFFRVVLVSASVYAILMLGPNIVPPFIYFNF